MNLTEASVAVLLSEGRGYGSWLSPSGKVVPVDSMSHDIVAIKILDGEEVSDPSEALVQKGWARCVYEWARGRVLVDIGNRRLTQYQLRFLKDFGIENSVEIAQDIDGQVTLKTLFRKE